MDRTETRKKVKLDWKLKADLINHDFMYSKPVAAILLFIWNWITDPFYV